VDVGYGAAGGELPGVADQVVQGGPQQDWVAVCRDTAFDVEDDRTVGFVGGQFRGDAGGDGRQIDPLQA
jgi:hypothetical protein